MNITRVGWVRGQVVLPEDLIALEDNAEAAINQHIHGANGVAAVPPENIPLTNAVGGSTTLKQHVQNASIHFRPNQNLPIWYEGTITIPALSGDQPEWTSDNITLPNPAFTLANYKVFAHIHFGLTTLTKLPDYAQLVTEIISNRIFRIHARFVYNPFQSRNTTIPLVWIAVGSSGMVST